MKGEAGRPPGWLSESGKWLLGAAFLAAPLTTLRPAESATFGDVFLLLAFGVAGLALLFRRSPPPVPRAVWIGAGILLVSIGVTVVLPPDSTEALVAAFEEPPYGSSFGAGMRLMVVLIALPIVVALIVERWSTIGFLINAWIIGVSISCLVAVIDACTGWGLQDAVANDPELLAIFQNGVPPRFMGLSVHPTSFSITAVMVLPLVLAKMDTVRNALLLSPVALVLVLGAVLSGSRIGILGLIIIAVLYVCVSSNLRKIMFRSGIWTLSAAVLVAAAGAIVFFAGPPVDPAEPAWQEVIAGEEIPAETEPSPAPVESAPRPETGSSARFEPSNLGSDTSSKERLQRFEDSLDFISQRPFLGFGFEWIEASHSIYLQLLVSGGILALIGFLTSIWGYGQAWFRSRPRVPDEYREIMLGLAVSVVAFLLMGMAQTDLLDRYVFLPVGLILAAYTLVLTGRDKSAS